MSFPKIIVLGSILLFSCIGLVSLWKKNTSSSSEISSVQIEEVAIPSQEKPKKEEISLVEEKSVQEIQPETVVRKVDKIQRLFTLDSSRLPIVETITYTSRVPWLEGKSAWISDYASYYGTSRHFIARSLNRKPDYFSQSVSHGDRFNVFSKDKKIEFYLVIDLSKAFMDFYYYDRGEGKRVFLKRYSVGLGRKDATRASGYLTPTGKYKLGDRVAIYKPGTLGYFQNQKIELVRIFGTRWIPFSEEVTACSESYKGYGIHGSPWKENDKKELEEDRSHIGKYDSDGCIRLNQEDMEELFSIIITKPTYVEIVSDENQASLPGKEVEE